MTPLSAAYFQDTFSIPGFSGRRVVSDAHYSVALATNQHGTFVVIERRAGDFPPSLVPIANALALIPAEETRSETISVTPHADVPVVVSAPEKKKGGRPKKVQA